MITANRSALVPKGLSSNAPTSPINVSDMIDFSIRIFTSSSSHCIFFCVIRASSSSYSAVRADLITTVRAWSLSVSLSSRQETCCFHVLHSRLQTEYMFLAIDTKRKTRWTYVISLKSSSVSLLIPAFRTSASVIRLRRLYDLQHVVVYRISSVLQLCPEHEVSLPVLVTAIHVRRAVFEHLAADLVSPLDVVISIPVTRTCCSISVILVNAALLFRRVIYRYFDFRETNIELPKCSRTDWDRHTPQLWTIFGVYWFSWANIEMSMRRVNSTQRVMMRLRRQNHKTKIQKL